MYQIGFYLSFRLGCPPFFWRVRSSSSTRQGENLSHIMEELTEEQIKRQDSVDNAIYQLIQELNPTVDEIRWDIEMIGDVRDVIGDWIVERLKITDEQNFYAWVEK